MAKLSPDDQLFTDGTTLKAYRQALVDRFSGNGVTDPVKVIASAKDVETYVIEGATEDERAQRRVTIERQLGLQGDAAKAVTAARSLDAYVNSKAA